MEERLRHCDMTGVLTFHTGLAEALREPFVFSDWDMEEHDDLVISV